MNTTRTVLLVLGVLGVMLALSPFLMMGAMMGMGSTMCAGMMNGGMMIGMMGQPMVGGGVMPLWFVAIVGVVGLLLWNGYRVSKAPTSILQETPFTILQRRYAHGEIRPEEYERIRSDLLNDRNNQEEVSP